MARGPGRLQRRARAGFAPASLFSPAFDEKRRHLSRGCIKGERSQEVKPWDGSADPSQAGPHSGFGVYGR